MGKCKVGTGIFSVNSPCENEAIYGWLGIMPPDLAEPFMCEEHFKSGKFKTDPPLILKQKGALDHENQSTPHQSPKKKPDSSLRREI